MDQADDKEVGQAHDDDDQINCEDDSHEPLPRQSYGRSPRDAQLTATTFQPLSNSARKAVSARNRTCASLPNRLSSTTSPASGMSSCRIAIRHGACEDCSSSWIVCGANRSQAAAPSPAVAVGENSRATSEAAVETLELHPTRGNSPRTPQTHMPLIQASSQQRRYEPDRRAAPLRPRYERRLCRGQWARSSTTRESTDRDCPRHR